MINYKLKKAFFGFSSLVIILVGIFYIYQYTSRPFNIFASSDTGTNSSSQIEGTPEQRLEAVSNGTRTQKQNVFLQQVHSEPSDIHSSMVIRSAYIDTRARNGRKHPVNTVVIFAEASMEIRKQTWVN